MKNVEFKKMSLANIENRLTLEEMENIMAGSGYSCDAGLGLCGLTFVLTGATPLGWAACAAIMLGCKA
jgi:hypothetical protein